MNINIFKVKIFFFCVEKNIAYDLNRNEFISLTKHLRSAGYGVCGDLRGNRFSISNKKLPMNPNYIKFASVAPVEKGSEDLLLKTRNSDLIDLIDSHFCEK